MDRSLEGVVLNQSLSDPRCSATTASSICCARQRLAIAAVTSQADWPSYNGQTNGSRYSPLTQITHGNVATAGAEVDLQPAEHRRACR